MSMMADVQAFTRSRSKTSMMAFLFLLSSSACAEWSATDSLREYMRQAPGTVHGDVNHLRGSTSLSTLMDEALVSARIQKVQSAMEAALRAKEDSYVDDAKFVKRWYTELDRRMGLVKYCDMIKGQGWDGECLLMENWWKSVKYRGSMDHPWQSH